MLHSTKKDAQSRSYEGDEATSKRDNIKVTEMINSKEVVACTVSDENVYAPLKSEMYPTSRRLRCQTP